MTGKSRLKFLVLIILAFMFFFLAGVSADDEAQKIKPIYYIYLEGVISPATAGFLNASIEKAVKAEAQALLVELDTPGGLGQSMRTMVKDIMNAPLPIIVYVSPSGAQAASAGVMITLAADIAAMAPGTNIGAAHPVTAEGKDIQGEMAKKVTNDMAAFIQSVARERGRNIEWAEKAVRESVSISADEALKLGVIDFVAETRDELLKKINGRKITREGVDQVLETGSAAIVEIKEGFRDRILKALANPNIAYILMMLGMAGLYFELSNPGAILPGVMGGIFIILAFYAFQTLPVNYAGVLLILLAIIFFILELKVTSYGMLSIAGILSLALGSIMLFKSPEDYLRVSIPVIISTVIITAGFFVAVAALVVKSQAEKSITGVQGLIGLKGPVKRWQQYSGQVFVHGELWNGFSDDLLLPGDNVQVLEVNGLNLKVKKVV